jgi:hypothetical protein
LRVVLAISTQGIIWMQTLFDDVHLCANSKRGRRI